MVSSATTARLLALLAAACALACFPPARASSVPSSSAAAASTPPADGALSLRPHNRRSSRCSCGQDEGGGAEVPHAARIGSSDGATTAPAPGKHTTPSSPPLRFAIVMMTYDRPAGHNLTQFALSIDSILRQTNPDWDLYITGDAYPGGKVAALHPALSRVSRSKLHWANLNTPGEQGRWPGVTDVWRCAGAAAANAGLERAEMAFNPTRANLGPIIIAHLDDDDAWAPDHLEVLARAYADFPEAAFVYTQSIFTKAPFPAYDGPAAYNNFPPRPNNLVHNSASWRLADFYGWRYRTCDTTSAPVDADMWDRMARHMDARGLKSVLVPQVTTFHLTERGRE